MLMRGLADQGLDGGRAHGAGARAHGWRRMLVRRLLRWRRLTELADGRRRLCVRRRVRGAQEGRVRTSMGIRQDLRRDEAG